MDSMNSSDYLTNNRAEQEELRRLLKYVHELQFEAQILKEIARFNKNPNHDFASVSQVSNEPGVMKRPVESRIVSNVHSFIGTSYFPKVDESQLLPSSVVSDDSLLRMFCPLQSKSNHCDVSENIRPNPLGADLVSQLYHIPHFLRGFHSVTWHPQDYSDIIVGVYYLSRFWYLRNVMLSHSFVIDDSLLPKGHYIHSGMEGVPFESCLESIPGLLSASPELSVALMEDKSLFSVQNAPSSYHSLTVEEKENLKKSSSSAMYHKQALAPVLQLFTVDAICHSRLAPLPDFDTFLRTISTETILPPDHVSLKLVYEAARNAPTVEVLKISANDPDFPWERIVEGVFIARRDISALQVRAIWMAEISPFVLHMQSRIASILQSVSFSSVTDVISVNSRSSSGNFTSKNEGPQQGNSTAPSGAVSLDQSKSKSISTQNAVSMALDIVKVLKESWVDHFGLSSFFEPTVDLKEMRLYKKGVPSKPWSDAESKRALDIAARNDFRNWKNIHSEFGASRTYADIVKHCLSLRKSISEDITPSVLELDERSERKRVKNHYTFSYEPGASLLEDFAEYVPPNDEVREGSLANRDVESVSLPQKDNVYSDAVTVPFSLEEDARLIFELSVASEIVRAVARKNSSEAHPGEEGDLRGTTSNTLNSLVIENGVPAKAWGIVEKLHSSYSRHIDTLRGRWRFVLSNIVSRDDAGSFDD